jgi:L,D-transpeptidase YbiS
MLLDHLIIDIPTQKLHHYRNDNLLRTYIVSTAAKGAGEQFGSWQTPRGWHVIRAKIGDNQPLCTIYEGRRPVGICTDEMEQANPDRDWILTRILWLSGLEVGKNRLFSCDTMRRYIYIHGCANSRALGVPGSKGCVRMRNEDIVELFDEIPVGTKVLIQG